MINEGQEKVIAEGLTPACVIAGPGTGKTFTIVKKVVDLVKNHHIPANKILLTTFTKKASAELNTRIVEEFKKEGINESLKDLKIGNFHSLASIYLDKYAIKSGKYIKANVIDSYMETYIIGKNIERFNLIPGFKETFTYNPPSQVQEIFESITNNLIELEVLKTSVNPRDRLAYQVYQTHHELLKKYKLMNFQMILKEFYDLLCDPTIGEEIRAGIDFVIIDEYQDTNYIQQEIAFKLLRDKNIMVFGDDDQSLYSFRGADPKNLIDFDQVCKKKLGIPANYYNLNINYRSNQTIVDMANEWMDESLFYESKKNLRAFDELKNENTVVRARADRPDNIVKIIKILNKSIKLSQIAFLFPNFTNDYPNMLENYLEKNGIPVINHSKSMFFNRREIRILVYIFAKIYGSYPSNLEGRSNMSFEDSKKLSYRRYLAGIFDDNTIKSTQMDEFIETVRLSPKKSLSNILYESFKLPELKEILDKKLDSLGNERALLNIGTFTKIVSDYENIFDQADPKYYLDFIYGYLFHFYKTGSIKEYEDLSKDYDAINFMTIHNSKGLEFDVVFVSGLGDSPRGNYPKILEVYEKKDRDLNARFKDFYRKYYTAMTRAKNLLVMLDNSSDFRLIEFSNKLNNSSVLSTIDFRKSEQKDWKPILAYTTDIEVYDSCSLKYKFLRKLSFTLPKTKSLIFGSLVHDLAEYLATEKVDMDLEIFLEKNPALKIPITNFTSKNFAIKDTEANYKADRGEYILQGNIDIILDDGSLLDIKTGKYDAKILEKYKNQLITYKYLRDLNGDASEDLYLYFIEKDELVEVADLDFDLESIDKIAREIIRENIYVRTPDINECRHCPMKYYCDRV